MRFTNKPRFFQAVAFTAVLLISASARAQFAPGMAGEGAAEHSSWVPPYSQATVEEVTTLKLGMRTDFGIGLSPDKAFESIKNLDPRSEADRLKAGVLLFHAPTLRTATDIFIGYRAAREKITGAIKARAVALAKLYQAKKIGDTEFLKSAEELRTVASQFDIFSLPAEAEIDAVKSVAQHISLGATAKAQEIAGQLALSSDAGEVPANNQIVYARTEGGIFVPESALSKRTEANPTADADIPLVPAPSAPNTARRPSEFLFSGKIVGTALYAIVDLIGKILDGVVGVIEEFARPTIAGVAVQKISAFARTAEAAKAVQNIREFVWASSTAAVLTTILQHVPSWIDLIKIGGIGFGATALVLYTPRLQHLFKPLFFASSIPLVAGLTAWLLRLHPLEFVPTVAGVVLGAYLPQLARRAQEIWKKRHISLSDEGAVMGFIFGPVVLLMAWVGIMVSFNLYAMAFVPLGAVLGSLLRGSLIRNRKPSR